MNPQQIAAQQSVNSGPALPGVGGGQAPNLLERLLPTIGSLGGMAVGSLADPVLGPFGTIGGGAAGSALGQGIENDLTGQNQSLGTAALEGGVGGGIGKGIEALTGGAGAALTAKAADDAAANSATADATQWSVVPKGVRQANDFNSTMDTLKNTYGITDLSPSNLADISNKFTGGTGAVASDLVRSAMEGNPVGADLTGTTALANQMANSPELATAGPTVGKAFESSINSALGLNDTAGTINNVPAGDVYQARQLLQNLAYRKGTTPALSQAYRGIVQSLDDALSKSGVDQTASMQGLSDEQLSTLKSISPQLAADTQAAANTSVGALRNLQRTFVNAGNLAKAHADYSEGILPEAEPSGGNGILGGIGSAVKGVTSGGHGMGKLGELGGIGEALMGHPAIGIPMAAIGAASANPEVTGALLSKVGGSALPGVLGQTAAHLPTSGSNPQGGGDVNSYQTQGANVGPSQQWAALFDPSALPGLQKAAAAQPALNALESQYGAAGGGQGLGGILSALSGMIPGTQANQYNREKIQAAAQLAQATGAPLQAILAALPSLMGSPQSAQTGFGGVQGQVSNLANINPGPGSLLAGVQ